MKFSNKELLDVCFELDHADDVYDVVCNGKGGHECDCQVEPDGCCEHGCPSLLIALGLI